MSLWGEIAEAIVKQIDSGALSPGQRLPSDADLAAQFNVNRHTVRRAISHLADEGLVRSERGRGSFVVDSALSFRLGARTKFEENLLGQSRIPSRRLMSVIEMVVPDFALAPLRLTASDQVILLTMLGEADGVPIHIAKIYFPKRRFPDGRSTLEHFFSASSGDVWLAQILACLGVTNYRRLTARFRARSPSQAEANHLQMPRSGAVLEMEVLNVDVEGDPVFFGSTCICGNRVEFVVDF